MTVWEGSKSKQVNIGETSFGLRLLVSEEGSGMLGDIGVPDNTGALEDTGMLVQRIAAGGIRPLMVDEEKRKNFLVTVTLARFTPG